MRIIKIPSKRIYNNEHSLAKNQISKIDAKENGLNLEKNYDATIGTFNVDISQSYANMTPARLRDTYIYYTDYMDTIDVTIRKTSSHTARFPIKSDNNKKTVVYLNSEQKGHSVLAKKTVKKYSFKYEDGFVPIADPADGNHVYIPTEAEIKSKFPNISPTIEEYEVHEIPQVFSYKSHAEVDFGAEPKLTATFDGDSVKAVMEKERVYADVKYGAVSAHGAAPTVFRWQEIVFETYIPKELSFSVKGDIEAYVPVENNKTYGDEDCDDYYSIETNELMLDTAKINNVPVTQVIAENIIDGFKNGKETYSLVCSIGDYYDEDGNLAISTKTQIGEKNKMMFDIGDIVIPYKPSASGDVVISSLVNGTSPKMFTVVGVTPIFDGAVWQKLDLLEANAIKEEKVIIEAIEERTETKMQSYNPMTASSTTTMNIVIPSNVDFIKINGIKCYIAELTDGRKLIDSVQINDKNAYAVSVSIVDGALSIMTVAVTFDVRVIKEPSGDEDGEFLCVFARIPKREYLFELHMS